MQQHTHQLGVERSSLQVVENVTNNEETVGQDTTVEPQLTTDHTGARSAPEATTAGAQQHIQKPNTSGVNSKGAENGEMECERREGIEEQTHLEEPEITVMTLNSSALPSVDGADAEPIQDTQSTTVRIGTRNPQRCGGLVADESNNSRFDEVMRTGEPDMSTTLEPQVLASPARKLGHTSRYHTTNEYATNNEYTVYLKRTGSGGMASSSSLGSGSGSGSGINRCNDNITPSQQPSNTQAMQLNDAEKLVNLQAGGRMHVQGAGAKADGAGAQAEAPGYTRCRCAGGCDDKAMLGEDVCARCYTAEGCCELDFPDEPDSWRGTNTAHTHQRALKLRNQYLLKYVVPRVQHLFDKSNYFPGMEMWQAFIRMFDGWQPERKQHTERNQRNT